LFLLNIFDYSFQVHYFISQKINAKRKLHAWFGGDAEPQGDVANLQLCRGS